MLGYELLALSEIGGCRCGSVAAFISQLHLLNGRHERVTRQIQQVRRAVVSACRLTRRQRHLNPLQQVPAAKRSIKSVQGLRKYEQKMLNYTGVIRAELQVREATLLQASCPPNPPYNSTS